MLEGAAAGADVAAGAGAMLDTLTGVLMANDAQMLTTQDEDCKRPGCFFNEVGGLAITEILVALRIVGSESAPF